MLLLPLAVVSVLLMAGAADSAAGASGVRCRPSAVRAQIGGRLERRPAVAWNRDGGPRRAERELDVAAAPEEDERARIRPR